MRIKIFLMLFALTFTLPLFSKKKPTKRVAILETVDKEGNLAYGIKLMIRNQVTAAITNTSGYEGYDRVDISSIMNEHEFQRTGMVSEKDIKQIGEMAGADFILIAEVAKLDDTHIILSAKILNVQTALVERTAVTQTQMIAKELEKKCRTLAEELLGKPKKTLLEWWLSPLQ